MSYSDYEHCPGCEGKALSMGEAEVPDGVVVWHQACLDDARPEINRDETQKVWIVLQGPSMAYYGSAEIHGVFTTEEAARARALAVDPTWTGDVFEPLGIEEWQVVGEDDTACCS